MRASPARRSPAPRHPGKRSRNPVQEAVLQALEPRTLMTTYTFVDQGTTTANATALQSLINGTAVGTMPGLQSGDILNIDPSIQFLFKTGTGNTSTLILPDRNFAVGSAPITIETSKILQLPSGRIGPSNESLLVQFQEGASVNTPVMATCDPTVGTAHDFTFIGIEFMPVSNTINEGVSLIRIGSTFTTQDTAALVPKDFVFDRCYIHGWAGSPSNLATCLHGISLDGYNVTIENSYFSEIHSVGQEADAINGSNGTGNFTITNNFLEASCSSIFFGGGNSYVLDASGNDIDPANITITHNELFKPLTWDPFLNDPNNPYIGVKYTVKNAFELKHAVNVIFDSNIIENVWNPSGQRGEAMLIRPVNQGGANTQALIHDVTITNNVILNCGDGIQLATNQVTDGTGGDAGNTSLPMYNVLVRNNLLENIVGGPTVGDGNAFTLGGISPGYNITIDHNTALNTLNFLSMGGGTVPYRNVISSGFTFTNNVALAGIAGGGIGNGTNALNTYSSGVTMTNVGSGYTSAPTVTFVGGLGAGGVAATGVALETNVDNPTGGVSAHTVYNIQITNNGSGYTSAPTVVFGNSGTGGSNAAASVNVDLTVGDLNYGKVIGWLDEGNVQIGGTQTTLYPTGNYFPASEDATGFLDTPGEEFGLVANSPYLTAGVDAHGNPNSSTPGVSMTNLLTAMNSYGVANDFVPLDTSLQDYYKFDAYNSSQNITTSNADSGVSGTQHALTLNGTATYSTSTGGNMNYGFIPGTAGDASATLTAASQFTFVAWVKPANFTSTQYIVTTKNSSSVSSFALSINSAGKLVATGTTGSVTSSTAMTAGNWYLVALTYDGTNLKVYQDGVQVGSVAATTTSGSTTIYLGGNQGAASCFTGTMDEVRYYTSALTASDLNLVSTMQRLYNNFSPLVGNVNPAGGNNITTSTTNLSVTAIGHAGILPANSVDYFWSCVGITQSAFTNNYGLGNGVGGTSTVT